jgi:hypothetical protein
MPGGDVAGKRAAAAALGPSATIERRKRCSRRGRNLRICEISVPPPAFPAD